jgi:hypothetical protein
LAGQLADDLSDDIKRRININAARSPPLGWRASGNLLSPSVHEPERMSRRTAQIVSSKRQLKADRDRAPVTSPSTRFFSLFSFHGGARMSVPESMIPTK